jgi:hypothetical protein
MNTFACRLLFVSIQQGLTKLVTTALINRPEYSINIQTTLLRVLYRKLTVPVDEPAFIYCEDILSQLLISIAPPPPPSSFQSFSTTTAIA